LVLGFHGCEKETAERLLRGEVKHLKQSQNKYDWLGNGIYFWENDPLRAWEFAQERHALAEGQQGRIEEPFVIGAVLDPGYCLNLMDRRALAELAVAHDELVSMYAKTGKPLPQNRGRDFGARFLDRAVVEMLHAVRAELDAMGDEPVPPFDSMRSAFPEGDFLYEGSGFQAKNHIQIAIRNPDCIKGYFRPIQD